jgi:hypothetical protein
VYRHGRYQEELKNELSGGCPVVRQASEKCALKIGAATESILDTISTGCAAVLVGTA